MLLVDSITVIESFRNLIDTLKELLKRNKSIIDNLIIEIEKLKKEKSKLNSELQALTEMYNECKKECDELKRKENKSKTLCDDCELKHKECHCYCAREFIPKVKIKESEDAKIIMEEVDKLFKQYKEHGYCLYGFTDLEDLIRFIIL